MKGSISAVFLALAVVLGSGGAEKAIQGADGPQATAPPPPAAPALSLRADQARLLRDALAAAPAQGFEDGEFMPSGLDALLQSPDASRVARGRALLMSEIVRYASALHRGRLTDAAFDNEWGMRPAPYDAQEAFEQALMQDRLKAWLDDLPPPYLGYQQLVAGLKTYRDIVAHGGWRPIPPGPSMKPGGEDGRTPALKARLSAEYTDAAKALAPADADQAQGAAPGAADPLLFDDALAGAVKAFQTRHGLDPTGVVDKATLSALNISAPMRVDQIKANMERWRWTPPVLPADRVQVNIAAAVLTLFRGDMPALSMRAVAGRLADHTPMLQSAIRSIVFNPPWNVPASIATKELWPKERAHPGYLAREDFVVLHTDSGVRLQQRAGPKSALGQIKFDFDNRYGVYLHDTPAHSAFARESRLVSHGCVRLQDPKALALMLLSDNGGWTADSVDAVIAGGDTQRTTLTHPTAVLIFYWTAFAGPDGAMNFRPDFYGWDSELMQRIAAGRAGQA